MSKVSTIYSKELLLEEWREPKNEIVFCWLKFIYERKKKKDEQEKGIITMMQLFCYYEQRQAG